MTSGDIVGTVKDASGAVVPNAKVTATSVDTNETRTDTTNNSGQYRFSLMKPGDYTVTGEATGLSSKTEKLTLLVGQAPTVDLTLQVKGTSETVEVQATAEILHLQNSEMASGFDTKQLINLPANGGDLTTIAFTVPGILVTPGGGSSGNFSVQGIPGASAMFTLNGADAMDAYLNIGNSGASNNMLGTNEVGEASVVLNAYGADYGRMAGVQVNYIGKSGGNSFHGNLFHNYNDKIFNANDFFNNQAGTQNPRSDAHLFGGSVGGPVRKDKIWFFVDFESLRYALPASGTVVIPSPQLQTYTLNKLATTDAAAVPLYQDAFNLWNNAPGRQGAVPTTNGTGLFQDGNNHLGCGTHTFWNAGIAAPGGGVFGGNNVPTNIPCTYQWRVNTSQPNKESYLTLKGDYNINSHHTLQARYNYDWGLQATSVSYISPALFAQSNQPDHQGQLTETWVINPNLVNKFTGSGQWYQAIFGYPSESAALALIPETMSVGDAGFTSVGTSTSFPQGRNVGQMQLVDDLTWMKGSHTFKAGINYRSNKVTDFTNNEAAYNGYYSFGDLTDFTTGQINGVGGAGDSFTQAFPNLLQVHLRFASIGAYVQDEWKLMHNVTLTLGFRAEHDKNPVCVDKCFARMNTQFGMPGYTGGAGVPYNSTITTGLSTMFASLDSIIPEPRFGLAWNLGHTTVLRGGIGEFASLFSASSASSIFRNAPSVYSPSVSFGLAGLPTQVGSSAYEAAYAHTVFENGFSQGATLAGIQSSLSAINSTLTFTPPAYYSPPNNYVPSKVTEWSFGLEKGITPHDVLAITYSGSHGFDQQISNGWANGFLCEDKTLCSSSLNSAGVNKYFGTSFAGLPLAAPDSRFKTVTQVLNAGYSNYGGLTTQIRHSFHWGFQGQVGWTWSHALAFGTIYNPYNFNFGYGNQGTDVRHAVVGDFLWTEPHKFSNKLVEGALGGWNIGAKVYHYTGKPFSSSDSNLSSEINSYGGFSGTFLATVIDPSISPTCTVVRGSGPNPCYAKTQFMTYSSSSGVATPVQMDFGQTGPGVFRGPGYFNLDTNIYKRFPFKERYGLELGAQFYNATNHPNFSNPSASITSSSLGLITGDVAPPTSIYGSGQGAIVTGRNIVVTAKFSF